MERDVKVIESICIAITFKCDLHCSHCYLECGPERTEVISRSNLKRILNNTAPFTKKIWFSGGEPTTQMKLLKYGLAYAKKLRKRTGYPQKIVVQTNGYWGKNRKKAKKMLSLFKRLGVTNLDISSDDIFHYSQMQSTTIPKDLYDLAMETHFFEEVSIGGVPLSGLKRLGRFKNVLNIQKIESQEKCSCYDDNFIVYPDGQVYNCKWAMTVGLGKAFDKPITSLYNDPSNFFARYLFSGGPLLLSKKLEQITGKTYSRKENEDICVFCKKITEEFQNTTQEGTKYEE